MSNSLPRRIVYTRHPECLHNVAHERALSMVIENRHSPLTHVGELQRDITAEYLRKEYGAMSAALCSTYIRTRAIPIAAGFVGTLIEHHLLDERNMGVWYKYPKLQVLSLHPGEDERMNTVGHYFYEPPGGESCAGAEARLTAFLESDALKNRGDTVYISAHGISELCLRQILTKGTVEDWHTWDKLKNASVSVYERKDDEYTCTSYNVVPWEGKIDPTLLVPKGNEL